jgi:uncharacterized membrane protein YedE/YeeE
MKLIDYILEPWPWYVVGPLIGMMVPTLLIAGNKAFGISSSLRHICAACIPSRIPFFHYDWKKESWNLYFVCGILVGAIIASQLLTNGDDVVVDEQLKAELNRYGIHDYSSLVPIEIFNFEGLLTLKGFVLMIVGGFLVGFGTRYAGGCTSGHSIMGLSTLQWPSLVATCCFMIGGMIVANFILPILLSL